jgi:hypothetical protein
VWVLVMMCRHRVAVLLHMLCESWDLDSDHAPIMTKRRKCWGMHTYDTLCAFLSFMCSFILPLSSPRLLPSQPFTSPIHPCLPLISPLSQKSCILPRQIQTHLCLCFGFLLQIIYTYLPFFRLTLLHPSHSFLTELRTFMPRFCGAVCSRSPLKRVVRSASVLGRESALQAQVGVWMCVWMKRERRAGRAKRVRRRGRRRERASMVVGWCVGVLRVGGAVGGGGCSMSNVKMGCQVWHVRGWILLWTSALVYTFN